MRPRVLFAALVCVAACSSRSPQGSSISLPTCTDGQTLTSKGGAWTCSTPASVPASTCEAGQIPSWTGSQWKCSAAAAGVPSTCTAGQTSVWSGTDWICSGPAASLPSDCMTGQVPAWTGSAWTCGDVPDATLALQSFGTLGTQLGLVPVQQTSMYGVGHAITPSIGVSMSATQPQVAQGGCVDVQHNWNTNALGYAAWASAPNGPNGLPTWIPIEGANEPSAIDLAAGSTATATSTSGGSWAQYPLIQPISQWIGTGVPQSLTVDLGSVVALSTIGVRPGNVCSSTTSAGTTAWTVSFSTDNSHFQSAGGGTCSPSNLSCAEEYFYTLPIGSAGRYVQFTGTAVSTGNCAPQGAELFFIEVHGPPFVAYQPDANTFRVCNYSTITRDLAVRVWK